MFHIVPDREVYHSVQFIFWLDSITSLRAFVRVKKMNPKPLMVYRLLCQLAAPNAKPVQIELAGIPAIFTSCSFNDVSHEEKS
jgi:hypothetical protein